ncbi:MAG TPA: alpha/beta fold hydrolase [Nocardioidaceae bacterium]|nr:alpha/beta fold hydrolase [Nocardioidaceae bacterium]
MDQRIAFCRARDGTRIAYATHGHGPPLVKVAHWLTHLEHDWRSPIWQPRLTALGARHRVVRYDCRDTGLSDREVERVSLDAWVEDLEAVVDAVGLERFPLLGISQGGPIAVTYAARHPERVSALVLCGAYARGRGRRSPARRGETEALATVMRYSWGEENAAVRQMWTTRLIPDGTPAQMRWLNDLQRWSASPQAAVRSYRTCTSIDVTDDAHALNTPTLVMHARGDAFVPFEAGCELSAAIPGATFVPLETNNHLFLADEPAWRTFLDELHGILSVDAGPVARPFPQLTPREQELVELVAAGLGNAAIADRLVISPKTVRNHITHVFDKLGVGTRAEAIVTARDAGLGSRANGQRRS